MVLVKAQVHRPAAQVDLKEIPSSASFSENVEYAIVDGQSHVKEKCNENATETMVIEDLDGKLFKIY